VVIITGHAGVEKAAKAMRFGNQLKAARMSAMPPRSMYRYFSNSRRWPFTAKMAAATLSFWHTKNACVRASPSAI
jgi:hypothetical protein